MNKLEELFQKPEPTERPLRILVLGGPKTGKSHFVFTATAIGPLYWQDTEQGADLYPADHGHGFRILRSKDPEKLIEAIEAANTAVVTGKSRPIVAVDSVSSVWFQQQEVHDQLVGKFGRFGAWAPAKKPLKKLYELLHVTRCHVILTARAKKEYEVDEQNKPEEVGIVPDVERNLAYAVDLVLHLDVNMPSDGKELTPENFIARVVGTRSPSVDGNPPSIPIGRVFKDPKFSDLLTAMVEGKAPVPVEDTTKQQVEKAVSTPKTFQGLLADPLIREQGWTAETAKKALGDKFGRYEAARLYEYWEYLKVNTPPTSAAEAKEKASG